MCKGSVFEGASITWIDKVFAPNLLLNTAIMFNLWRAFIYICKTALTLKMVVLFTAWMNFLNRLWTDIQVI